MAEITSPGEFNYQAHHYEVEILLREHEAIADIGIVAVPHVEREEVCHAYICMADGYKYRSSLLDEFNQMIREEMPESTCLLDELVPVEEMPRTRSGKIARQQLTEWVYDKFK